MKQSWRMFQNLTSLRVVLTVAVITGALFASAGAQTFKNAHNDPPPGWTGPVFKLSQNYPKTLPALEPASKRPWRQFNFKDPAQSSKYIQAVLNYCLEGNTANNFADVSQNSVRKWYHAPWLDTTPAGREFIHGMTAERGSKPGELGPAQTSAHDNWAVGFYNARGGYTIGQVWKDPKHPDPRKATFPSNTVACKLLFSTAPISEVPFLDGSLEWQGDINRASGNGPRPTLHLLQLDVAVKDSRANSTIGWVFGTFQYEKAASTSANWWDHMVPVGLMWGSDVTSLKANTQTREEWINTARGQKLHLGRKDLVLNGPIDNPRGSCTSCHGFAQVARVTGATPSLPGLPADVTTPAKLDAYFTDIKAATPLSPDYVSLDYSLQLQIGIARALHGGASLPPDLNAAPHAAHAQAHAKAAHARHGSVPTEIPEVRRDSE
jgi:hypothetical protein